jgi:hypothetical protein
VVARLPKFISGAGVAVVAGMVMLLGSPAGTAGASPTAAGLYQEAIATTKGWTVHYVSTSTISKASFLESGDTGPASGTQSIRVGKGSTLDVASLIVIGDLTYIRGNKLAMEDLTGLSAPEAAIVMNHWVLFSSNNPTFAQVVVGVRSHDVAQEVAMQGPFSFGPSRSLDGHKVDALRGTQKLQGAKKMDAVLYVRASGRHLLIEEDTVGSQGEPNGAEHIVFSKWGELVRPQAPDAAVTLGSVNTA